jgi:hypothetical protein
MAGIDPVNGCFAAWHLFKPIVFKIKTIVQARGGQWYAKSVSNVLARA